MDDGAGDVGRLLLAVVLNYLIPEKVFMIIASIATFATVWVWLMILLSQIVMRRTLSPEETRQLSFPVPWWPVAPALATAFMAFVIGLLGYFEESRIALYVGLVWIAFLTAAYWLWVRKRRRFAGDHSDATDVTLASAKTRCGGFFYCACASACRISACRSSNASSPADSRTSPSLMWCRFRSSGV